MKKTEVFVVMALTVQRGSTSDVTQLNKVIVCDFSKLDFIKRRL